MQNPTSIESRIEKTRRPNILLITADQWRGDYLSAAGHPCAKTPNVDPLGPGGQPWPPGGHDTTSGYMDTVLGDEASSRRRTLTKTIKLSSTNRFLVVGHPVRDQGSSAD